MDDVITGLPNSLSSQPGTSISMPKNLQNSFISSKLLPLIFCDSKLTDA